MIDLSGKRASVTGGSRGTGAAIASALAENGADVALTYQSSAGRAEEFISAIQSKGRRAVALQASSADPGAIIKSVQDAVSALGSIDILVNSAGIGLNGPIAEIDIDQY